MELKLQRKVTRNATTLGTLEVDGEFFCYTLEDAIRKDPDLSTPQNEAKVYGQTAIPAGRYEIILNHSPRFKKVLPRLMDVPGFTGILIHAGNTKENTDGCILVGDRLSWDRIVAGTSTKAFLRLMDRLTRAKAMGQALWIEVADPTTSGS